MPRPTASYHPPAVPGGLNFHGVVPAGQSAVDGIIQRPDSGDMFDATVRLDQKDAEQDLVCMIEAARRCSGCIRWGADGPTRSSSSFGSVHEIAMPRCLTLKAKPRRRSAKSNVKSVFRSAEGDLAESLHLRHLVEGSLTQYWSNLTPVSSNCHAEHVFHATLVKIFLSCRLTR